MSAPHEFETDLRRMVKEKQVVVIVGSGVSIASTNRQAPTWEGLITGAAEKCHTLGSGDAWFQSVQGQLAVKGDLDLLLSAAELVHKKLEGFGKGEFSRWLRELLENLQPADSTLINAIASLNATIVTTNYDDLVEKATGLRGVTWKNEAEVTRTIRGEARQVIHLHGHWNEPGWRLAHHASV